MYHNPIRRGATNVNLSIEDGWRPDDLQRIRRLARELRLTDQILSYDLDTVSVVPKGPAPAWTTLEGDHISFNMAKMPLPTTAVNVAIWLGTNAHELGHVLFSPREDSPLMQRILAADKAYMRGIAQLHNIAEDQRQERLILGKFSPWTAYLTAALGHHLVADSESAWLLMTGRTWLPDRTRQRARDRFVKERSDGIANEVTHLIAEYQRLTDPGVGESQDAWEILEKLHALFDGNMPKMPPTCTTIQGGEPDTEPDTATAPPPADEADKEPEQDTDAGGGEPSNGEGEPDDNGDPSGGDSAGNADADGTEADAGSTSSSEGAGSGKGKPEKGKPDTEGPFDPADISKELKDAAQKELEENAKTHEDLDSVLDALDHGRGSEEAEGAMPTGENTEVTDSARRLHHTVGDALLDLKDQAEPGWVKRVESGRLSVQRVLNPRSDPETWFDRYEPGQLDASEMEVVVLLDVSSSMHWAVNKLAEAAWAIRMAVDDLEGRCTVITYDAGPHRILADAGQRPDARMYVPTAQGGTEPNTALAEAYHLLADSTAKNRLMVVLTDGQWFGDVEQAETVIDGLNAIGVFTALAYLVRYHKPGDGDEIDSHHCQWSEWINTPEGLAILFRRIAAERITRWL